MQAPRSMERAPATIETLKAWAWHIGVSEIEKLMAG